MAAALVGVVATTAISLGASAAPAPAAKPAAYLPPVKHAFVINLENKGYDETWGPGSAAPYLSGRCGRRGTCSPSTTAPRTTALRTIVAQVSGQGPNPQTQGDCQVFSDFAGAGTTPPGQYVGDGCVLERPIGDTKPTREGGS